MAYHKSGYALHISTQMNTLARYKGFTLVELLLSLGILSLIITAIMYFMVGQNNSYIGQKERLALQENARMSMDFITRSLRGTIPSSITASIPGGTSCNNNITFLYGEEFGRATAGGANTLTDSNKNWTANQWQNYKIKITGGTGQNQVATISSNTATLLTTSANWATPPSATSTYEIISENEFTRSGNNIQYRKNNVALSTLAENVTCFTITKDATPPTRFDIIVTMTTSKTLPDTGNVSSVTLQSTANLRN